MIVTILITVSVTLWCIFSFALYGYHYLLEVILDLPIIGESPCTANSALKLIIQKIIKEANNLPKLKNDGSTNVVDEDKRTYENLLSAAILNKIISNSQNNISVGTSSSSRANSVCSHKSSSSRRNNLQKEYFFGEETLDNKWKNIDTDTASVSSLEEWVHSDSSLGSTKYVDRISLTIKQRIEEVSSSESDQEDEPEENDDAEYFRSNSSFGNNEPNWFLKKRQFRAGTISPVPVPMLVPNPTTEAKVLIGDKEVDDTSDLSDVPSDFEDGGSDPLVMDVKNHLIGSKSIIGGKNPLADLSLVLSDDDVSADSGVKECKDLDEDSDVFSLSKKHMHDYSADASIHSDGSNNERDLEYTERYATLPRQILISPKNNRSEEIDYSSKKSENGSVKEEDLKEEKEYEFAGLYSKREKQKWKQAVELKNNPYSKENIEKRIKSRNSINSLFGSDYYIRQACLPSGAKRSENEKTSSDPECISEDQKNPEIGLEEQKHATNENNLESDSSINADFLDTSEKLERSNSSENIHEISDELQFSSVVTSDSELSLVNCYNVSQSVIYTQKLSADNNEEIQTAEQFLDCESFEDHLNVAEEIKEEYKPVAKPRKRLKSENNPHNGLDLESQSKVIKNEETNDEGFNAIPYVINKRSDNTLIKKIYSNPSVRLFALNNRNKLPISIENSPVKKPVAINRKSLQKRTEQMKEDTKNEITVPKCELYTSTPIKENASKTQEFEKELVNGETPRIHRLERLQSDTFIYNNKNYSLDCDALDEINKLKEQKLVANRLKEFSKSSINLSEINEQDLDEAVSFGFDRQKNLSVSSENEYIGRKLSGLQSTERSASVKDLMKKFEQFEVNGKVDKPILYSLTGRSISKQFKEKLRDLDEQPSLSQIQSLSLTDVEVVENAK